MNTNPPDMTFSMDSLLPPAVAERAVEVGVRKAATDTLTLFLLAVLAGAFIALGAIFATTLTTGGAEMPYGVTRLLAGLAFSLGLMLVVVGGAELFTGNNLIVMAWASGKVSMRALLRNWGIVYLGNFVGALLTVGLMFVTRQYTFAGGAVGANALAVAEAKSSLGFSQALALGIMCNALVCMAIWMAFSARTTGDRIVAIIPPITCFIAAGFEHSIANMYYIPLGLCIQAWAPASFWAMIGSTPDAFPALTCERFLVGNLLPVTIGNVIGGAVLVGAVYWLAYSRPRRT